MPPSPTETRMAAWVIESEKTFEDKHVAALGREEYDRRLAVANAKADELKDDWREQMFMRPQFQSIAMQASAETFAKMEKLPGSKWSRLIYRLAAK